MNEAMIVAHFIGTLGLLWAIGALFFRVRRLEHDLRCVDGDARLEKMTEAFRLITKWQNEVEDEFDRIHERIEGVPKHGPYRSSPARSKNEENPHG